MHAPNNTFSNPAIRKAVCDMLAERQWDYFVTASLHKAANQLTARNALKDWHKRLDRKLLGGRCHRKDDARTFFMAFVEGGETNLHWHMLVKLNCEKHDLFSPVAEQAWSQVVPSGTLDIQQIQSGTTNRVAGYATKGLYEDKAIEGFVISTEFQRS
jgi:hypothetical protein